MKKLVLLILITTFVAFLLFRNSESDSSVQSAKTEKREREEPKFDAPDEFQKFQMAIRTANDEDKPGYKPNHIMAELMKAKELKKAKASSSKTSTGIIEFKERGPSNVPGRTRITLIDPDDPNKNTWYAGSVGGGVWKTTDSGSSWTLITPDLPNLATTVLAMSASNPDIMLIGTGEGYGNIDAIDGSGIFKSTDRGNTWTQLTNTIEFNDINRIVIDPIDPDIFVVASNNGIYRSVDGGTSWTQTYDASARVQDLRVTPGDFNTMYAAENSIGVIKSIDGGVNWASATTGLQTSGRIEIDISPVNTNKLFASVQGSLSGGNTDLYMTADAGLTWNLVDLTFDGQLLDYLGGQGWYDNTIACHPYDENIVYAGGVELAKIEIGGGGTETVTSYDLVEEGSEVFMDFINFSAGFSGGRLEVDESLANGRTVEIRFGSGLTQKAHRFQIPAGEGPGVPASDYAYQDYVSVPFQVWEVDSNGDDVQQLMVSFRDQQRDGEWNLIAANTAAGDEDNHSREYIFINDMAYDDTTPDADIAQDGGHEFNEMYFFWPILADGGTFDPDALPTSKLVIEASSIDVLSSTTSLSADVYSSYDGKNSYVHPDQHYLNVIPMDDVNETFKILLSNDGGLYVTDVAAVPGIEESSWNFAGFNYNTSQFYGADKAPEDERYIGGLQDNGTWLSPEGEVASKTTEYEFKIGGDGFEVIWNNFNPDLLIGGSQFNGFRRSANGGNSFVPSTSGLSGDAPFVSKLANSKSNPDRIYTISSAGVFVSNDFGSQWELTAIDENFSGGSSLADVEVSRSNANIVWAGAGMIEEAENIYVSVDGGKTFSMTNNYTTTSMGGITKLASHPYEDSTAFALFSFSGRPKVVKTDNLGESWTDISGFEGGSGTSTNGFPDVAVYCLLVRNDNPDIIWAGTEIGIVESVDNGASWEILDDFPNVSVWDLKIQDDEIIIATHGRGIWTAKFDTGVTSITAPEIVDLGISPQNEVKIVIQNNMDYDETELYLGNDLLFSFSNVTAGTDTITFPVSELTVSIDDLNVHAVAHIKGVPKRSEDMTKSLFTLGDYTETFRSDFDLFFGTFSNDGFSTETIASANGVSLSTGHPYANDADLTSTIVQPIVISDTYPFMSYKDVAIVEPGNDYVVVEATKDGLNWVSLLDSYDASADSEWQSAFNSNSDGDASMYVNHTIDLLDNFNISDTVLIRFRLHSDSQNNGWGWSIDDILIQEEPTSVDKSFSKTDMAVFPNPSNGEFFIQNIDSDAPQLSVSLFTLNGVFVKRYQINQSNSGYKFSDPTLKKGVYLMKMKSNQKLITKRIVIQ